MKPKIFKKTLITVVVLLQVAACQRGVHIDPTAAFPVESAVVKENGSIPPGLTAALNAAGIDADCIPCNSQNRYGRELKNDSEKAAELLLQKLSPYLKEIDSAHSTEFHDVLEDHMMWWMVRGVLIEGNNNNFGAVALKDLYWHDEAGQKHPVIIFRGAFTPDPAGQGSCYRSLLAKAGVKHVVNLYDGEMYLDDLVAAERDTAAEYGATYVRTAEHDYGKWRDTLREHPQPGPERERAMADMGRLIREQVLAPGGKGPRGNIFIHCGGGMHRTGMIVGVIQKVLNGTPLEKIADAYRYHVGYRGPDNPGGFEQGNLDVIRDFKAEYLER